MKITLTTINLEKKQGTKTVFEQVATETKQMSGEQYKNCVDASPFFRRLGGTEKISKSYTSHGYLVTKIVSTSPDKLNKTIRHFSFD